MTADQIVELAAQGRFWWYRPSDKTFHTTDDYHLPQGGDVYLLDASEEWKSQWQDWQAAADHFEPFMSRLESLGEE